MSGNVFAVLVVALGTFQGDALSFSGLFTGGAVLQQGVEVAVYGTSHARKVTLSLDGSAVSAAVVATDGHWIAYLPPQNAAWHRTLKAEDGSSSVEVSVSFGAVLLCSGQSNMDMPVANNDGFAAANGTAEVAASGRYTDKIWLATVQARGGSWNGTGCNQFSPPSCVNKLEWNKVTPDTLPHFSAVCWYTGKALFESLGGKVPIGLMKGSVGGSPIEFWLPPGHVNNSFCGVDNPPCDQQKYSDSAFYNFYIKPLVPYTLGAVIWDQGERDVHCFAPATNHTAQYPCMERELIHSWRNLFNSSFSFVAVQLPGYIGDCDAPGVNPKASYFNCVPGVFDMRIAQEMGTNGVKEATAIATYDLSCPFGVKTTECPWGSVHNIRKTVVGERVALELRRLLFAEAYLVTEGPRAISVTASNLEDLSRTELTVAFSGGTAPFYLKGTQYCEACCKNGVGDFDASADGGISWFNATSPQTVVGKSSISFIVQLPQVTHVRYTANQGFPQCALYNQEGLPAMPFSMKVRKYSTQYV